MQSATTKTFDEKQLTNEKLIVALDVSTAEEARNIVGELNSEVAAFKIGLQLFVAAGNSFVSELVKTGAKVFLDLKFHDIPNTVERAAIEATRLGVWMFNVHAAGGREMMERTVDAVRETAVREGLGQPSIIAVTVLTSADGATLRETGIENAPLAQVVKLAKLADSCGLDGVVASPLEIEAIRQNVQRRFSIVTPGIRLQSNIDRDDQTRVLTALEAINAGADYLVIGRPILRAENRIEAVREILAKVN